MGSEEKHDLGWSIGFILTLTAVFILLVTDTGRGLDQRYVSLFTGIYIAAIVGCLVLLVIDKILEIDDDEYTPTIVSSSETRGLARHWSFKVSAIIFLSLIFVGGSAVTQTSLIPIIDPFNSTTLVTSSNINTISGTFLNSARSGLYPGFGEDTIGYVFVSILTLALLWLWRKIVDDANSVLPLVLFSGIIASVAWGFVFATAHMLAYGINGNAYIGAFLYGFISQLVNFLVGAPVSIVAHFLHNFTIIFSAGLALSIGGIVASNATKTGAAGVFFMKTKRNSRRAQASLIAIFIAFLLIAGAAVLWYNHSTNNKLDIGGSACSDYANVPGTTVCATDADCFSQLVPAGKTLDNGVSIRCANTVCQAKFQTCTGSVAP